tara:strand:+ start:46 stop:219 length:174 start_codon:yes stop_codon:yes gene_type:complete
MSICKVNHQKVPLKALDITVLRQLCIYIYSACDISLIADNEIFNSANNKVLVFSFET